MSATSSGDWCVVTSRLKNDVNSVRKSVTNQCWSRFKLCFVTCSILSCINKINSSLKREQLTKCKNSNLNEIIQLKTCFYKDSWHASLYRSSYIISGVLKNKSRMIILYFLEENIYFKLPLTSPIMTHWSGSNDMFFIASRKNSFSGFPTTSALTSAEYSRALTKAPA